MAAPGGAGQVAGAGNTATAPQITAQPAPVVAAAAAPPATCPKKKVWQELMRDEAAAKRDTSKCGPWCRPWATGNKEGCDTFGGDNTHHKKYCHKVCVDSTTCQGGNAVAARFVATKTMLRHN